MQLNIFISQILTVLFNLIVFIEGLCWCTICAFCPALLYLSVHVLKVFYEQINYY